jgi:hypothetical protein
MGCVLEMREGRRTIEPIHKCMLCHLRSKYPHIYFVFQQLIETGPVIHWRMREWEI